MDDGADRAGRDAEAAINADLGIDDYEGRPEVETVDRTVFDAVRIPAADAGFGDDMGHGRVFR